MINEPNKELVGELLNDFNKQQYSGVIKKILNLQLKYPKSIFLLNLLGATYNELNNYEEAIECFNKIIIINKNFSDAYYNLGIIYKRLDKIKDSISNYNECIKLNPNKFEAYNNLGNIYRNDKQKEKAVEKYLQCLEINSSYIIALQNFGICLQNFYFKNQSTKIDKYIINLLKEDRILRPVDIINTLIHYLYLNSEFKLLIENFENLEKKESLEKIIDKILKFKILFSLLDITPITDQKIENFLIHLRRQILKNIYSIQNQKNAFEVMQSLAKQCFINEYLYPVEIEEEDMLKKLENRILNNFKDENYNKCLEIACLASYKPLNLYHWTNQFYNFECISEIINQQIKEPNIELSLSNNLINKDIKDTISIKVKDQYENNPYPRWTKISLNNNQKNVFNYFKDLKLKFNNDAIKTWDKINVLVAGCGTGQHAITTATKYKNSFITAIDLSSKSLGYAKRKANELKIDNINFIKMDILDIKSLEKNFEIIETVGVLHHMDDPYKGLENLYNVLKPNGLIMIGVYSKIARKHIERIRNKNKNIKYKINNQNLKLIRQEILKSRSADYKLVKESPDFYSLSTLRDLIFHVQEHRFSIPEIETYINKLNLKFCGFVNREIIDQFEDIYRNKNDLYNLDIWNTFEVENPRIFAGMYQFWCQKI